MNNEDIELVRGSGNVFRDFNISNADAEQLHSILAAQIIKLHDVMNYKRSLYKKRLQTLNELTAYDQELGLQ